MTLQKLLLISLLVFVALTTFGCQGTPGEPVEIPIWVNNPGEKNPAVTLSEIGITPGWVNVAIGDSQLFKATATFKDGHKEDYTQRVIWMVDGSEWTGQRGYFPFFGRLETLKAGTLTITVKFNATVHGHAQVGVFDPMVDTPPKPPINLKFSQLVDGDILIDWDINEPVDPDLLGFNIYRSRHSLSGYQQLNFAPILQSKFVDDKAAGGIYFYVVTAIDIGGNESDYSLELTVDNR